ncbi:MAG TPA: GNAT family N-acetyltransferase [Mycobacteriales bacterium]|nr:GNAT family N-acetyltransferase [Mycobacteriales bacterium]
MHPIVLHTERLVLRGFTRADIAAVHAACQDPAIQRWTTVPSPYRLADAESFVTDIAPRGWSTGEDMPFAVTRDGALLGAAGLHRRGRDPGIAEVGFWCAAESRGQGYVTEAVREIARWAFEDLGVQRLEWYAEVGNTSSRRVAEKLGFSVEGLLRKFLLHRGDRVDGWVASLLPGELVESP